MLILRIPGALFCLVLCLLFTAGEEAVRLRELKGNTVTIHTGLTGVQSDAHILWFYRSEKADIKIVDSLVFEGKTKTDYNRDRFRDRLLLDRSSGSLTIRNISREDSGLYTLQIITRSLSVWSFSVKVYAPVSKPVIEQPEIHSRNQIEKHSRRSRDSWSPECSVENGENVSLSWYKENERISSISRADSSDRLHLPLNRTFSNSSTYTCVSANPVSNQTTQLNITAICDSNTVKCQADRKRLLAAVLIPVGLFVALLLFMLLLWLWKKKRKQPVPDEGEVNYAEVKTSPKKTEELQNSKGEEKDTRIEDQESVVYSDIMT